MFAHYVAYNHQLLTAIIIGRDGDTADLAVFTNLPNAAGKKNFGLQFHQDVKYSEEKEPGTWHHFDVRNVLTPDEMRGLEIVDQAEISPKLPCHSDGEA